MEVRTGAGEPLLNAEVALVETADATAVAAAAAVPVGVVAVAGVGLKKRQCQLVLGARRGRTLGVPVVAVAVLGEPGLLYFSAYSFSWGVGVIDASSWA